MWIRCNTTTTTTTHHDHDHGQRRQFNLVTFRLTDLQVACNHETIQPVLLRNKSDGKCFEWLENMVYTNTYRNATGLIHLAYSFAQYYFTHTYKTTND